MQHVIHHVEHPHANHKVKSFDKKFIVIALKKSPRQANRHE